MFDTAPATRATRMRTLSSALVSPETLFGISVEIRSALSLLSALPLAPEGRTALCLFEGSVYANASDDWSHQATVASLPHEVLGYPEGLELDDLGLDVELSGFDALVYAVLRALTYCTHDALVRTRMLDVEADDSAHGSASERYDEAELVAHNALEIASVFFDVPADA